MRKIAITSNMLNEANNRLEDWIANMKLITDTGIIVVDGGSKDGTKEILEENGVIVVVDNIIQREGYGPARNHLRQLAKEHFPDAHWNIFFDCDERIDESDIHKIRWIADYLGEDSYDVVAFPRIDWYDYERTRSKNDIRVTPDFQARMTRLGCPVEYLRILHEQVQPTKGFYANVDTRPPIQHFNRCAGKERRHRVGKLCAYLHSIDKEHGNTYPKHHKEDWFYQKYLEEGLD
jgi:glycosyltransferase involved in cell wall biosynthesis